MKDVFIVEGIRTPVGSLNGSLSKVRTDDLAVLVIQELIKRNPAVDFNQTDDVILGCANQAGEDNRNLARMASLMAGLDKRVPGETVNRLCASGMAAIINGSRMIASGDGSLVIAGGVESMTRAPYVMSKPSTAFGRDSQLFDSTFGWRFINPRMHEVYGTDSMGETAENLVERYHISRTDQDQFACWSQQKAAAALHSNRLAQEIIPVTIPQLKGEPIVFAQDEFIKPQTTVSTLSKLKPAFKKGGTVTAGNSSGMNDGACVVLLADIDIVRKYNLKPLARIISSAVEGVEPRIMGIGPVSASAKALKKAGKTLAEMDLIELNEAFAAQSLACIREWGLTDSDPRINPNGGAIAIGHPLGMSGARILLTAASELQQQNKKLALVTMCVGVGQGYAVILEKV
ncbi:MAG: acetyl-CoA C-acyltransferase [Bacteroidia bacterium]|nr:acetyl-CoA C-acyltransferase [Bacteroidia bacterium]